MDVTWYSAADMQLFIFSPIFIYCLWRWWKIGLIWTVFVIACALAAVITVYVVWELPPTGILTRTYAYIQY